MTRRAILLVVYLLAAGLLATGLLEACSRGAPQPEQIDTTGRDTCAFCRMVISDIHTAAQLVAPGEEPKSFDDLGCLRDYLAAHPRLPRRAAAYVADHRTGALVPAARAIYTRQASIETPMRSRLIAHVDAASRAADPPSKGGVVLSVSEVFGTASPPEGK